MVHETYDKNRVINFSDAVFSIVMTLLILEVGVPSVKEIAIREFGGVISSRIPDFIGLFVSFMVSALYWIGHIKIMKYVTLVRGKLLWLNIYFLLAIVILPFSTAMFVNGFDQNGPFIFYCVNLSIIGLFNLLILRYVYISEKEKSGFTRLHYRWYRERGLNVMLIWVLASVISLVFPLFARGIFLLLFLNQFLIDRYYKKKLKVLE